MAILNNPQTVLVSNDLRSASPLDAKTVFIDIASRDALLLASRYHGMTVFVQDVGLSYRLTNPLDLTNTGWVEQTLSGVGEAPINGLQYARKDAGWVLGGGLSDAPVDGTTYGRKDATWISTDIAYIKTSGISNVSAIDIRLAGGTEFFFIDTDSTSNAGARITMQNNNGDPIFNLVASKGGGLETTSVSIRPIGLVLQWSPAGLGDKKIELGTNSAILIRDDIDAVGLRYPSDYSTNGISLGNRWIPDYEAVKAYADSVAGSPLTTKGDLFGFSTGVDRLPIGIDGQILSADNAQSTGLNWIAAPPIITDTGDVPEGSNLYYTEGRVNTNVNVAANTAAKHSHANLVLLDAITSAGASTDYLSADGTYTAPPTDSPLSIKGDIYSFSTIDARLSVGSNGQVLSADSAETTGLKWIAPTNLPGGSTTQIQFNNAGAFGGNPNFIFLGATAGIQIPVGTTAERPGVEVASMFRYNSTISTFEGYDGSQWANLKGSYDGHNIIRQIGESSALTDSFVLPSPSDVNISMHMILEWSALQNSFDGRAASSGRIIASFWWDGTAWAKTGADLVDYIQDNSLSGFTIAMSIVANTGLQLQFNSSEQHRKEAKFKWFYSHST